MRDLLKVVDCCEFGYEHEGKYILLSDYENIDCKRYESQLKSLIKNKSFEFDDSKHECWELG